jgi:hypothetical protein
MITKETITSYGWHHLNGFFYEFPIRNEIEVPEFSNRPVDFRLNFVGHDRYIELSLYERNGFEWETGYRGPCRTEEEFL